MTWEQNSSFSKKSPKLQLALDSTSIGAFKVCPQYYEYSIIEGWVPRYESVHLTFGLIYHAALERYDHAKAMGAAHEESLHIAVHYAMCATWDEARGRPWSAEHAAKNRETLIRTIIWYLDEFKDDPLQTIILANGKPAVELSFQIPLPYVSSAGEQYTLCGHLDRLATFEGQPFIMDRKTTGSTINQSFFSKFTPHNQFTIYTIGANVAWHMPVRGLIVDAAQIAVTFSRFMRSAPIERLPSVLEEWVGDLGMVLAEMEQSARVGRWRKNDMACDRYGGCPFRLVCGRSPEVRAKWLEGDFTRRMWNPLQARGDI